MKVLRKLVCYLSTRHTWMHSSSKAGYERCADCGALRKAKGKIKR